MAQTGGIPTAKIDRVTSEKSSLSLKCRSMEDKMNLLNKQLEANEKYRAEYLKRYEDATNEKKQLSGEYMSHMSNLQRKCSSLEERFASILRTLESTRQESVEWKRKYKHVLSKQKAEEEQTSTERAALKSRTSAAEARLAATLEQVQSAQEEAEEWKRKYDIAVQEAKAALEKAAVVQERSNKNMQAREDALRAEFISTIAKKEEEARDKTAKFEHAEKRWATLTQELKAELKIKSYSLEIAGLKSDVKELSERLEAANATAQSSEREAKILEQEKNHLEEKYRSDFSRFDELQQRCKIAEKEAKRATEVADEVRSEAVTAQKEKSEIQRIAMEILTQIERSERQIDNLEREKTDLVIELKTLRASEIDAIEKVRLLEAQVEERKEEIDSLMKSTSEQRATTVQVLESLLETERAARVEANQRAEALLHQLQATQGKLDMVQQELTSVRLNESALDAKPKTTSHRKHVRVEEQDIGFFDSVHDIDVDDRGNRPSKRRKSTTSAQQEGPSAGDGDSSFTGDQDNHSQQVGTEDYTKFTVEKLKEELTKHDFGHELYKLKPPKKKELIVLYERCILNKC